MSENQDVGLLTVKDVAEMLRMTVRGIRGLVFSKRIPFLKIGRLVRFSRRDIEKWIENSRAVNV